MVNVVFNTAFVGDLILNIPLLRKIKRHSPAHELILVCRPGLASFFKANHLADIVIELDKKNPTSVQQLLRKLDEKEIEYFFCPHESFRSAWILSKIKAKHKVGYKSWWNAAFFDTRVERPMVWPEALRSLTLLEPFDEELHNRLQKIREDKNFENLRVREDIEKWPNTIAEDLSLHTEPQPDITRSLLARLKILRPYVVIAPCSQWATKEWPKESFAELIHLLAERGLNIYLVGTKNESQRCLDIEKIAGPTSARVEVRSLAGQTDLCELHALLAMAEAVIANDSGPMHMAAAAGRPVIGIFGPTTTDLGFRPWSNLSAIVQVDLPCRPCGKHGHHKCPIGTHDCMKKIKPTQIAKVYDRLMKRAHPAGAIIPSQIY